MKAANVVLLSSSSSSLLPFLPNLRRRKPLIKVSSSLNHTHFPNQPSTAKKIIWHWKQQANFTGNETYVDFSSAIHMLSRKQMPYAAEELFLEMKSEGFLPCCSTLLALLLCYADNGLFSHSRAIWDEIMNSSYVPNMEAISHLMDAYGKMGHFNEVDRVLHEVVTRYPNFCSNAYSSAISSFGKAGQLDMMESTLQQMVSSGVKVDSATGNAFLKYYSKFGSLHEMEVAYGRLKRSRILIEEEVIKTMAYAYINKRQFYKLGEFTRDVGLGRVKCGNLLWNLLLLSYAANFKMKSMQREFLRMVEAGFSPDLTTFNIRAAAFSKMSLLWDLHVSLEHMKHENVNPDIVTYGCVIDTYLDRKLGMNLDFALSKMNMDDYPLVLTDPLVFEVLGKGDFHSSSEAFLEYEMPRKLTYRKLIQIYLKKKYRSNQIFWNY